MRQSRADFASFRLTAKTLLAPLLAFQANCRPIHFAHKAAKRGSMNRLGHFAAVSRFNADRLLGCEKRQQLFVEVRRVREVKAMRRALDDTTNATGNSFEGARAAYFIGHDGIRVAVNYQRW
jgi:hypothetical protein